MMILYVFKRATFLPFDGMRMMILYVFKRATFLPFDCSNKTKKAPQSINIRFELSQRVLKLVIA